MLDFREPRITDRAWIAPLTFALRRENCEYCFGNIFCWSPVYRTYITRFGDFFLAVGLNDGMYCFPMGQGDLHRAIDALRDDAASRGWQLRMYGVSADDRAQLEAVCPGQFDFIEDRSFFDYIYLRADLAALPGKRYHAKRNHIASLERAGGCTYEPITPDNMAQCMAMAEQWARQNADKDPAVLLGEQTALRRAFDHYEALELRGAALRRDGEVIAFTVGEALSDVMFVTHFEKAYADIRGAYPAIKRDFAARELDDFTFINREEDTGDEGLRKAKLSYHPAKLLVKYEAVLRS